MLLAKETIGDMGGAWQQCLGYLMTEHGILLLDRNKCHVVGILTPFRNACLNVRALH